MLLDTVFAHVHTIARALRGGHTQYCALSHIKVGR